MFGHDNVTLHGIAAHADFHEVSAIAALTQRREDVFVVQARQSAN